jgi:putative ABC transport system permease protein
MERRKKEVSIRKVLGASVLSVTSLLTLDFLKWVILAIILASPLSAWMMQHWLEGYAYRIDLEAWMFMASGMIVLVFALGTVCLQSIRTALENPVKSLRNE